MCAAPAVACSTRNCVDHALQRVAAQADLGTRAFAGRLLDGLRAGGALPGWKGALQPLTGDAPGWHVGVCLSTLLASQRLAQSLWAAHSCRAFAREVIVLLLWQSTPVCQSGVAWCKLVTALSAPATSCCCGAAAGVPARRAQPGASAGGRGRALPRARAAHDAAGPRRAHEGLGRRVTTVRRHCKHSATVTRPSSSRPCEYTQLCRSVAAWL